MKTNTKKHFEKTGRGLAIATMIATLVASAGVAGLGPGFATPFVDEAYAIETSASYTSGDSLVTSNTFTFSNSGITISGEGTSDNYKVEGCDLTINASGVYEITGSSSDASISVKKGVQDVTIILNGVTLSNDGDKVIKFKQGASGSIVIKGENTLSSSNDKGIIKANAVEAEEDVLEYDNTGHTTGGDLVIYGDGTLNLSSDYTATVDGEVEGCDAINCEGDLTVLSGTFNISVTDDGMHSDNALTVGALGTTGPVINITKAEEGLEGATVNLISGTGNITTSDDGINAANKDLVAYNWQYAVNISGGIWNVVTIGDGIDSNGNLNISGGKTIVYCTGGGNGPLDYGDGMQEGEILGSFTITGGELLAVGSDMLVAPTSGNFILFGGGQGGAGSPGQGGGTPGDENMTPPAQGSAQNGQVQGDNQQFMSGAPNGQQPPQGEQGVQTSPNGQQPPEGSPDQPPSGNPPQDMNGTAGSTSKVVTKGQAFSIVEGNNTLYSGTAEADGTYVLYASDALDKSETYTLVSGQQQIETTVGTTDGGTAKEADTNNNNTPENNNTNNTGEQTQNNTDNTNVETQKQNTTDNTANTYTNAKNSTASNTTSTSSIAKTDDVVGVVGLSGLAAAFLGLAIAFIKRKIFF